jgi:hypothetical protein
MMLSCLILFVVIHLSIGDHEADRFEGKTSMKDDVVIVYHSGWLLPFVIIWAALRYSPWQMRGRDIILERR